MACNFGNRILVLVQESPSQRMIPGILEGWDLDRVGYPIEGDFFVGHLGVIYKYPDCDENFPHPVAIVSPAHAWKILRPCTWEGKPTRARFKTRANDPWTYGMVVAYRPGVCKWKSDELKWYRICETWRK